MNNPVEAAPSEHGPICFCAECLGVEDDDLRRCCPSYRGGYHYLGCPEADRTEEEKKAGDH